MKLPTHARIAAAALLCIGLPQLAQASAVYGTLSNFDVYNDSTTPYHGFEIELEDFSLSQLAGYNGNYYTYPNWHYGSGQVSQSGTNVLIRYSKAGGQTAPFSGNVVATNGHACITITGCEHFGVSLNGAPTATRYFWLDENGNRSTQVNLLAPVMTVVQPAVPAQNGNPPQPAIVRAEVEAPEVIKANGRSDAIWVQVFKREVDNDQEGEVELDDLMADNGGVVADEGDGVEIEWKLFQRKPGDDPANLLDSGEQEVGDGMEQVLRTYRFYKFAGTYDASHEATCTEVGNCEDLAEAGEHMDYVGALIGQQMVALNLDGALPPAPVPVPLPASVWLLGSGLFGLTALARRHSRGV